MKKLTLSALAGILALSLTACGNNDTEEQTVPDTRQAEYTETTNPQRETEPIGECRCATNFQHACCEYLNGLTELWGGVYFGDINGDNTPEAVISKWTLDKDTIILYRNENGIGELHLEPDPNYSYVGYISDAKQILFSPFYVDAPGIWGYAEYYLYGWNGKDYEVISSILREEGDKNEYYDGEQFIEYVTEYGQAYIDGEPVDNDTFEIRLAEIEKLRDENSYFPIVKPTDENFESYVRENFPCFDNWDIVYYK